MLYCRRVSNSIIRKSIVRFQSIKPSRNKIQELTKSKELLDSTDVFVFDCDGVIWRGDTLIENVPQTLDYLRKLGKSMFFVTNNSTQSRQGYLKKFNRLGLSINYEEIFSSSFAVAAYFQQNPLPEGKKVYIIGHKGIGQELDMINVPHLGGPEDAGKVLKLGPGVFVDHDRDVAAVVVGFDPAINYYKIQYAQLCINTNPGCKFIATNLDAVAHVTDAQEWAANGSMVGAIKGCTGIEPILVGKPAPLLIDYIVDKYNFNRDRICMVGDRLDTDILFGLNNGLKTVLTLSGVTDREKLHSKDNTIHPDYVVTSIADFLR